MDQKPIYFTEINDWRKWLSINHKQTQAIWLLFYKKTTGKPTLMYNEMVKQALCYGWIDGTVKSIDSESYIRKLTPRKNLFNWSETNRKRVEELIKNGEMTKFGLAKIGNYATTGKLIWPEINKIDFTSFSEQTFNLLKQNKTAYQNYQKLTAKHQSKYIQWVMSAKKEETQTRRMKEAVLLLERNTKNLLK